MSAILPPMPFLSDLPRSIRGMDHLEYEYADHVLCVQPSEFEKEIVRGVFGKEPLPRPVVEIEYKAASKRTECNPIILTALAEIKNGLQELKGLALTPAPKPPPESSDLAEMEKRIIAAVTGRKPDKKSETQSPFIRQKDAIKLLGCRSVLEACEKAGWLTATTRRARLVQYKRQDVLNCAYRLSHGEYP